MDLSLYFLVLIIIIAIIAVLIFLFKQLSGKGHKKAAFIVTGVLLACVIYCVYFGVYPDDSFYFEDFKKITLSDVPSSAKIIAKDASYPDQHGDYISVALIRLSRRDYNILLTKITHDKRFSKGELTGSKQLNKVVGPDFNSNQIKVQFIAETNKAEMYIVFLDDGQSVITCFAMY
jgi:hypothetical protein